MLLKVRIVLLFLIAFLVILSVPVYFLAVAPSVPRILTGALGIKVNPDLAGGEVMALFHDEYFDDNGTGSYVYPRLEAYRPFRNHLDLLKYIVKKPVRKGVWNDYREFWAVELVMGDLANPLDAPSGFSFPVIYIYIGIDGLTEGRTGELFPGTNIRFDPAHPWQFCVKVHGWTKDGSLFDVNGKPIGKALVDIIHKERLRITIPLIDELENISEDTVSYHYVMIGNFDPLTESNMKAAIYGPQDSENYSVKAASNLNPNIYDYLAPSGATQHSLLSGYDLKEKKYAVLEPVVVKNGTGLIKTGRNNMPGSDEQRIYESEKEETIRQSVRSMENRAKKTKGDAGLNTELAILYFQAKDYSASEDLLTDILKTDSNDPVALSYMGAITAQKASSADNFMKKISYVNEAIAFLDRAKKLVDYNSIDAIHVLMCRGNVYSALPDDFIKREEAIADLETIAGTIAEGTLDDVRTDALVLLGDNYLTQRKPKFALDKFHEALRIAEDEYVIKNIRDKICTAEDVFLDTITMNF